MAEKAKKSEVSLAEIEKLEKARDYLKKEIEALQIQQSNLEAQKHTEDISNEDKNKLAELAYLTKHKQKETELEKKRVELEGRLSNVELQEERYKERLAELIKRENELIDLEKKQAELNRLRTNFEMHKIGVERELEQAKIIIAEANASEEKIRMANEALAGRERVCKDKEKYWNDEIGKLEADKKAFQIEKENFEGLKQVEVNNV